MTDRRQRLLDALTTIIAERGLDQVSIREVAAAADVSIGTVQYYCRSKDEMLLMTWEYVAGNIGALMCTSQAESVRERLRQDFLELLPLDESRSVESRVYLAFSARAAVSAPLAEVQHSLLESLRIPIAKRFQEAKDGGEASPDLHPSTAAAMTVALIDGLLVHMLTDPSGVSREMAAAVLDAHLDCCFTA